MDDNNARMAWRAPHPRDAGFARLPMLLVAIAILAVASAPAKAGFTEVHTHSRAIFKHAYGGPFRRDGLNFSNGEITATRVDDAGDQIWQQSDAIVSARAVAAFSRMHQTFGYFNGTGGGTLNPLFTVTGRNFHVAGETGALPMIGKYRLGREGEGRVFSSSPTDNKDGRDHMVTYAITGIPNQPSNVQTWMLFWEDKPARTSDFNFNDLVVELKTDPPLSVNAPPPPLAIPLPPAGLSGLTGLLGLALAKGIGRLRRISCG